MFFLFLRVPNDKANPVVWLARFVRMTYLFKAFRAIVFFYRPVVPFFLLLCATIASAKEGTRYNLNNDYVLIINSYMESNPWSNSIITPVADHVTTIGLNVFAEHISVMNLGSYELLDEFESELFEKYKNRPPRLLILLDNPSLLLKDAIQRVWKDIPIILCAEQDFILPSQCYFSRILSNDEGPVPLSSYLKDFNITFLHCPVYLKENIELIRYVVPNMKELIFVADDWIMNKQIDAQLSWLIQTEYAQIKYRFLSSEYATADEVMEELSHVDAFTTGVLFSSWFQRTQIAGNTLLLANSHKVFAANSIAPIFSLRYTNIRYGGMVGGHIFDQDEYIRHLLAIISGVIQQGMSPRNIPYYRPRHSTPTFNYAVLLQRGLSLNVCPPGSTYIVMPPTFFQKYKYSLFVALLSLLTITFVIIQQNRIRILRKVNAERKRMQQALLAAKERAEESNRFKSAFLANISHEIRTPLNAIVGFSTILMGTENKEEKREYMDIIEKNNELLLQLINDIIYLSEMDAGRFEIEYTIVDLNRLMERLATRVRSRIVYPKIELVFVPALSDCRFLTDKDRFVQILSNLLSNAVKFTLSGGIRFGYEMRPGFLYFYVTDTGCGIPASKREAVFKRFVKLNDFSQGAGLGLSICQIIVRQMGGEIGVISEVGVGSTFWFTLPYENEKKAESDALHPEEVGSGV